MTINGQGYRETFLRCIAEGYDMTRDCINGSIEYLICPYTLEDSRYEYEAWHSGKDWYLSNVH
jgi:hypothetical protein